MQGPTEGKKESQDALRLIQLVESLLQRSVLTKYQNLEFFHTACKQMLACGLDLCLTKKEKML